MYDSIHQFDPLLPGRKDALAGLAEQLIAADSRLGSSLHPKTRSAIGDLVRVMNCYYSNLIEGHHTFPAEIERALRSDFSDNKTMAALQRLALAHIRTEQAVQRWVESGVSPYTRDFVKRCHLEFCRALPPSMLVLEDGRPLTPGEFRTVNVTVGEHLAPDWKSVQAFMDRFETVYGGPRPLLSDRLVDIAAAHHRFVWIHPFSDGNGRVARLMTGAMLQHAGVNEAGLWSLSRGFAKKRADAKGHVHETYKSRLHDADQPRLGDYDGRGNLSAKMLDAFCSYVLRTAIDQAEFMAGMIDLPALETRFRNYFEKARPDIKSESTRLIAAALAFGEFPRGEAERISGLSDRVARDLLGQLVDEGFLVSDSPKGPVRVAFPVKALGWTFPNLYPEGSLDVAPLPEQCIRKGARRRP